MKYKRAYIVVGPESSGTRMATKILLAAGCHGGSGLSQTFDHTFPNNKSPIAWRRSAPHGGEWPKLTEMAEKLYKNGYLVQFVVTNREWYPMICSQVENLHVTNTSDAYKNIVESYFRIMNDIQKCENYTHSTIPYVMFYYESLIAKTQKVLKEMMPLLDLPVPNIKIYDGNKKWYENKKQFKEKTPVKGSAVVNISENIKVSGKN